MELITNNFNLIVLVLGVAFLVVLFWLVCLQYSLFKIKKRQRKLFSKGAKNLEEVLYEALDKLKVTEEEIEKIKETSKVLNSMATKSIQKVGLVRFNPFQEVGGNQSFAIALLDLNNNGLVISSLHGRDQTRIYSKPIEGGRSQHNLSSEEKEAISKAVKVEGMS